MIGIITLGIVIEPLDEREANPDSIFLELHGCSSMFSQLTFPLNSNLIFAGRAPFEAPDIG